MILYRPLGMDELALIYDSGFTEFPPRLPEQPIFYPILNLAYAEKIARDWNTKSNSFAGYVTRFEIKDDYASQFERRIVGGSLHEELWIPAESLSEFNRHFVGRIAVVSSFFGDDFVGFVPEDYMLKGKSALEQPRLLFDLLSDFPFDFDYEISSNSKAVYLNFRFWEQSDAGRFHLKDGEKTMVLEAIKNLWPERNPDIQLT